MNKNLIIKLAILLLVALLVYSIFWFFKIGQLEKKINNFIGENSSNISAGEVEVSGYPLLQKVVIRNLKFSIPTPFLSGRQIMVKELEAHSGIFSNDFEVVVAKDAVTVQSNEGEVINVAFNREPEISFSMGKEGFVKGSYRDIGYKIVDAKQNTIYASAASVVGFETVMEGEKITNKINVDIREIEGFDVISVYKNSLEKKITDGLKTGQITLGSLNVPAAATTDVAIAAAGSAQVATTPAVSPTPVVAAQPTNGVVSPASPALAVNVAATAPVAPIDPNAVAPVAVTDVAVNSEVKSSDLPEVPLKSNFLMNMEYSLVPSGESNSSAVPLDPTQIQELPTQYSKVIKVTSLEFSNPLYKIIINGELNNLQDDNLPSGSVSIKIEKIDNFLDYVNKGLSRIKQDDSPVDTAAAAPTDVNAAMASGNDSYKAFLNKVVANLNVVAKDLAAKNAVSKEDIAVFDIRREKNLEFLINETSIREILGKF